jgi:sec-independent protein translocase protein TatB
MADSLILMVLALVVFGPRRLPQIGRQIGKLMYEFRKASNDFQVPDGRGTAQLRRG